jgi:hypothetical protein
MNWHLAEPGPALVVHPAAASLDEAHAAIELWEFYSRKVLDGAQRLAVEHMLAEGAGGLWAASSTGRAESRQNGKGDEIEVVELWGLTQRGEAILHTAHEAATAASAHVRIRDLIMGHRDLRRRLGRNSRGRESVQSWNGNYRIEMADGSFIVHRTRTSSIGRGLDDISRLVVDEAQHAQEEQLASVTPILAVAPNPQKNYIGSAGLARSAFWWRLRKLALSILADMDGDDRFAWLEHSAEVVYMNDAGQIVSSFGDVADREVWSKANPAYLTRISEDFLSGQLRDMGPERFAEEHLCVWAPPPDIEASVFPLDHWSLCENPNVDRGPATYAIEVDQDGYAATIAASDGLSGLVLEWSKGSKWLPAQLAGVLADKPGTVWLNPKGPAAALLPDLADAGIEWQEITESDLSAACTGLYSAVVEDHSFRHHGQPVLDIALKQATRKPYGNSWVWDRRRPNVSVSPLVAVTIARWAALQAVESVDPSLNVW